MNIFSDFQIVVGQAVQLLVEAGKLPAGLDLSKVTVEPPRDFTHGDISTNVAMVLAKPAGLNPRALAELVLPELKLHADVEEASLAGPGFINLKLKPAIWPRALKSVLEQKERYGSSKLGQGSKVNVEYVSANPTGPLHVGHCRGAVFGDALAALLQLAGYDVTREYYINDAGAQVDVLAQSAFLRYREALGEHIGEIPAGLYPGDYLEPVGAALAKEFGPALKANNDWLPLVRDKTISMMMDMIRDDLAALNIKQEIFFSEKSLQTSGAVKSAMADLEKRDLVYVGKLPPPKGEVPADWEDRDQTLFRSSNFGDDTDRPLVKSDGSFTYFASDVAYSRNKIERGFNQLVYVLGADHGGYVKRITAVAKAFDENVQVDVKLCQLVKLFRNGEPVRMSKRAGDFVTLREVVDEVGADVVRFMMLYRKNEAPLDFDFAKVTEQSKDNPVFYVQYAHARICSVLRNAPPTLQGEVDFALLTDEAEKALIRRIVEFPRLIEAASLSHEPHRISFYLYELASDFHSLWNKGKELPQLRFILEAQGSVSLTRLAFLQAIRYCLANGLKVLGVTPVEEM
ncbi:arginine--tRNA ligase [Aestuariivirga litoralis]|uniref:arginine--tRNA ligase n=1 Tax=Aestuariivirga litoralis TaxID=2650924 RepID=UPI0018C66080|nr:arginine--tRNA ligase [Aestuariivirga litoralis]MBG1231621.1 arginine--tRNA ligase [Aestuariivirga litoralis]